MLRHAAAALFFCALLFQSPTTGAARSTQTEVLHFSVKLRGNTPCDLGATVITSDDNRRNGATVLVLPGFAQTAKTFTALAQGLIAAEGQTRVRRMILLDYPGHGNSGFPVGLTFGDLNMDDYVTALLGALDELAGRGLAPGALMGHSLGAELIQLAQQRLADDGTSLKKEFGIKAAIFLVPDLPAPLPWAAIDAGALDGLLSFSLVSDPVLGDLISLDPTFWVGLYYADRNGVIVPGAPTPDQALASGFIAREPAALAADWVGLPDAPGAPRNPRPGVLPELFGAHEGTRLGLITLEQDGLYDFPAEHAALYVYLTADADLEDFTAVTGPTTVHNIHTIVPGLFNDTIKGLLHGVGSGERRRGH